MYRKFYGLEKKPFELAPVGGLVYLSETHKEGLATLRYGVISNKGFLLLTGGVGTGKTTMLNTLLDLLKNEITVCVLNNPALTRDEFYSLLASKFGIEFDGNKGNFLIAFANYLDNLIVNERRVLLIIDEAQAFPTELLEEIRLLSNQAGANDVLSIFLIGQPELREVLADPKLLPLRQRIGLKYHLEPLSRSETFQYIIYRLNKAGAPTSPIFYTDAVDLIYAASQGNPRLINVICDNALISGFSRGKQRIDKEIISECIADLQLTVDDSMLKMVTVKSSSGLAAVLGKIFQYVKYLLVFLGAVSAFGFIYVLAVNNWQIDSLVDQIKPIIHTDSIVE